MSRERPEVAPHRVLGRRELSAVVSHGAPRRMRAFTILEIMISVAILTIGLMGILALFPVAIETGKLTIQETNAALIAQSIEQAIREGIQHRKGQTTDGRWAYFLFQHEGVRDPLPDRIDRADPSADYYILFPDTDLEGRSPVGRERAYDGAKTFVYPETDGKTWEWEDGGNVEEYTDESSSALPNGSGNPENADDDGDDRELDVAIESDLELGEEQETSTFDVFHVYRLGRSRSEIEESRRGPLADIEDPLNSYSYAFSIRRAFHDANVLASSRKGTFAPQGELYEVNIMIFRSFLKGTTNADPIYQQTVLVHK